MVARDGVEPPTPAFSGLISVLVQQLNCTEWPQFCDHSVTSADVRLSVGFEAKHRQRDTPWEPCLRDRGKAATSSCSPVIHSVSFGQTELRCFYAGLDPGVSHTYFSGRIFS